MTSNDIIHRNLIIDYMADWTPTTPPTAPPSPPTPSPLHPQPHPHTPLISSSPPPPTHNPTPIPTPPHPFWDVKIHRSISAPSYTAMTKKNRESERKWHKSLLPRWYKYSPCHMFAQRKSNALHSASYNIRHATDFIYVCTLYVYISYSIL